MTRPLDWSRRRGRKRWYLAVACDPTGAGSNFTACGLQLDDVEGGAVEQRIEWPEDGRPRPEPICRACLRWLAGRDPRDWKEPPGGRDEGKGRGEVSSELRRIKAPRAGVVLTCRPATEEERSAPSACDRTFIEVDGAWWLVVGTERMDPATPAPARSEPHQSDR